MGILPFLPKVDSPDSSKLTSIQPLCTVGIVSGMRMRMWMTVIGWFIEYRKCIIPGYAGRGGFFQTKTSPKVSQLSLTKISIPVLKKSCSLRWRRNLTSVSTVSADEPRYRCSVPQRTQRRTFEISFYPDWQIDDVLFERPNMACTTVVLKSGYTGGVPEQGFWRCLADGLNQPRSQVLSRERTLGTRLGRFSCVWWRRLGG